MCMLLMLPWLLSMFYSERLIWPSQIFSLLDIKMTPGIDNSPPPQVRNMTYSIPRVWRSNDKALDRVCCYCLSRAFLFFTPFWWAHVHNNHGSIGVVFCKVNFRVEWSALQMYIDLILVWWSDLGLLLVHVDPMYRSYLLCRIRFQSFAVKILIMGKKYRIFALMKKLSDRDNFNAFCYISMHLPSVHLLWVPIFFCFIYLWHFF